MSKKRNAIVLAAVATAINKMNRAKIKFDKYPHQMTETDMKWYKRWEKLHDKLYGKKEE